MSKPGLGRTRDRRGREGTDGRRLSRLKVAIEWLIVLRPFGLSGLDSHPPRVQGRRAASAARGNSPGNGTLMAWVSV
jgi:hypothetical protein